MKLIRYLTVLLAFLVPATFAHVLVAGQEPPWLANQTKCGINCLFMLLKIKQYPVDYDHLNGSVEIGPKGASLAQLQQAASQAGLRTRVVRCDADRLSSLPMPVIAHLTEPPMLNTVAPISTGHYVLLLSANPKRRFFEVIDGSLALRMNYAPTVFYRFWDGYVLVPDESIRATDVFYPAIAGILACAIALRCIRWRSAWADRLAVRAGRPRCSTSLIVVVAMLVPCSARAETSQSPARDHDQFWRVGANDGLNCLALLLDICGKPTNYEELRKELVAPGDHNSLGDLYTAARRHGLATRVFSANVTELKATRMPAIVHVDTDRGGTFYLIYAVGDRELFGFAGATMLCTAIPMEDFRRDWSGYVLVPQRQQGNWLRSTLASILAIAVYARVRMRFVPKISSTAGRTPEAGRITPAGVL